MNAIPSLFDSSSVGFGQRSELSLHRITRLLFKHGMLIAFCFVAVTAAVAYGLKRLPPTYISTAKVLVKLQESRTPSFYSGVAAVRDPDTQESANRGMETEMEIAETWPISAEVVTALGLKYDQVYHPPYMHLLRPLSDFYENYIAPLLGFSPDPERRGFADTVGAFRNSLDVKPIASKSSDTNSNILVLELRGVDRELTRRALDEVVSVFLRYDKRTNLEAGRQAQQVIAHRAEVAANEVSEAQFRLEAFLAGQETAANNSADPYADGGRGGTLAGSQLHGRARSEMLDDGLKTQDATAPGPAHSASKPSNTDGKTRYWFAVDRLKSRLQQSQIELLNLRKGNPAPTAQSRALESEIASLTSQLDNVLRQNAR
ncbi:MAG: Wzz/FepE/Etk N-terminal domain-containing protein, partial [Methylocella sp.]